jgi:GTPase SAR1 family protein
MRKDPQQTMLRLGDADAWNELELESLKDNFLPVRQYDWISEKNKIYLCGRRGSGKSAIGRMLSELDNQYEYSRTFQGERSEYGEYLNIVNQLAHMSDTTPIRIKDAIRRLWLWALPVAAMQTILLQDVHQHAEISDSINHLRQYIDSLSEQIRIESHIGILLNSTFQRAKLESQKDNIDNYLLNLSNTPSFLNAIEHLAIITKKHPVLLVFDTLESYEVFNPIMIEGLKGIIEAINTFLTDPAMTGVSIKFFLPAEIYEQVMYSFPGKVQSRTVMLQWKSADLIAMLSKRYLSILKHAELITSTELVRLEDLVNTAYATMDGRLLREKFWYETQFLPRTIMNAIGQQEDTFAYILRHTMRRPRDIVTAQMQFIINRAYKSKELPQLSASSVVEGVHSRAAQLQILKESLASFERAYPESLVAAARSAFNDTDIIMSGRDLKKFAKRIYDTRPTDAIAPEEFVNALLRCGLVGILDTTANTNSRAGIYYKARFEHLMKDSIPLSDRATYCVHPVMADVFSMNRFSLSRVVYPLPEDELWLEEAAGIV